MAKGSWREFEDLVLDGNEKNHTAIQEKACRSVRIQRTRNGKGGKTVTIVRGLCLTNPQLKKLLQKLKKICGTGGTVKEEIIELQGDQVKKSIAILEQEGFSPKQAGG